MIIVWIIIAAIVLFILYAAFRHMHIKGYTSTGLPVYALGFCIPYCERERYYQKPDEMFECKGCGELIAEYYKIPTRIL